MLHASVHHLRYTDLTEGLLGDNSQLGAPLRPFVSACVFSAGQLQCNLTSVHLDSFTEGHTNNVMSGSLLHWA